MDHYWLLEAVHLKDAWLTIGSFDGVHLGHQSILKKLTAGAHSEGVPAVVVTFHPHPATVLKDRKGAYYLTTPEEQASYLAEAGADVVITHPFNRDVANQTAPEFIQRLKLHLGMTHLCVGHDFALGHDREGNLPTLEKLGKEFGYSLEIIPPVTMDGQVVSSSLVRAALLDGDLDKANILLGRPFQLSGTVIHGDGRGRRIGIPTANLLIWRERVLPRSGVYACVAAINGTNWNAVINVGVRPTFETPLAFPQVEAHLLDYSGDLYNQRIQLSFLHRLREERRFPGIDELVRQIHTDIEDAREYLQEKTVENTTLSS